MALFRIASRTGVVARIQTAPKKVFRVDGALRGPRGPVGPAPVKNVDYFDGVDGADGRDIELQNNGTFVQWRYLGDETWLDLVDISVLAGADGTDGREVQLQANATHIQWKYDTDPTWTDLVALAALQGAPGTNGNDGVDGLSAYELAVNAGFVGTEAEWIASLEGAPGTDGTDGSDGYTPVKGVDYFDGADGTDGTDGDTWFNGSGAPAGGIGKVGDYYLDNATGSVYEKTGASTWAVIANIKGPAGSGTGDMVAATYDPAGGARQVAFADQLTPGVTDHGALTGLGDDDHTQYHNDTRGDARYYVKSAVDAFLASKSDTTHNHALASLSERAYSSLTGIPSTFAPSAHVHPTSGVTGLDTALAGKAASSHTHGGADITGTGKGATTFLRGDNTWVVPTNTTYTAATQAEIENSASTTARLITGQRMAQGAIAATASLLAAKAPLASPAFTGTPTGITKAHVGLGNADNTADISKPVSTAQQSALDLKANKSILDTETINQNSTLVAFGDSITAGDSASIAANRYVNKIAAYKGWSFTNNGVGGSRINDPGQIGAIYATVVAETSNYTLLTGTNDMRTATTNKALQDTYRLNLEAALAWLALPDSNKKKANAASATGTWTTNASTIYGGMGRKSTTNGSTLTFSASGTSVYVAAIRLQSAGAGEFSVTVDGISKGVFSCVGSVPTRSDTRGPYAAVLFRIPNLTDTVHSVVITVTSPTNAANEVYIDWVAGNGKLNSVAGPNVWVGNCLRATSAGYASYGGSDVAVGEFNNHISDVVSNLASDGLGVTLIDAVNSIDYSTEMDAGGLHPNDSGHDKVFKAFIAGMSSIVKTRDRAYTMRKNGAYIEPTFLNSWTNWGTPFSNVAYMKDANGFVHLRGLAKSGSIPAPIFILPEGFRPAAALTFPVRSNNLFGYAEVYPNGNVTASAGNNAHFGLDGITFLAER